MYVWLDALTNYITAVGYPGYEAPRWKFWPADVHFVGKDILRFHAVYWPAFLMAAGLPRRGASSRMAGGPSRARRCRKSLGNVDRAARAGRATYGLDPVRYFLLREVPFGERWRSQPAGAGHAGSTSSWRTISATSRNARCR